MLVISKIELYDTCGILDRSSANTAALVKSSR